MLTIEALEELVVEKFKIRLEQEYVPGEESDVLSIMDEVIEMRVPLWTTDILELALSYPPLAKSNSEI